MRPQDTELCERPKLKRMDPETSYWERMANQVARAYVSIVECQACGGPRARQYKCTRCGEE